VFRSRYQAASAAPGAAQAVLFVALAGLTLATTLGNFNTFFNRQKNSPDVWAAHSVAETIIAEEMNHLAPVDDVIVTSLYANSPTIRFIAPAIIDYQQWTVSDRLPLAREPGRGVALLLDPLLAATVDAARRYYPLATYREFGPPGGGSPQVYELLLSDADLRSVQGLVARYYRGDNVGAAPSREEAVLQLAADWTRTVPLTGTFTAEYRGALYAPSYGLYRILVSGVNGAAIYIDETAITDAPVPLAKGLHALRVRLAGAAAKFELQWQPPGVGQPQIVPAAALFRPPVTNSGLLGEYFQSPNWTGRPVFTQIDPEIALYFHNIPLPRPYTVQWTGKVYAPAPGVYRFATESIDESQVMINNQVIVNNRGSTTVEGSVSLSQGWNDIVVRFADHTSHTHVYLYWTPPGAGREIVPSRYLTPPMGRYPTDAEVAALPRPLPSPDQGAGVPGTAPGTQPTPAPAALLNMSFVQAIGGPGNGQLQFNQPHAVTVGTDGHVFVADSGNRRVQALDANGDFLFSVDGGEDKFVEPFDLVATSTGGLVVLDSDLGWLYLFDAKGNSTGRIGGPAAQFYHPRGLSIDAQDNLYVADTGGSRVVKLSLQGTRLQVFGTRGNGRGQFIEPTDAALDRSGYLFATDVPNRRMLSFTTDGRFVLDFPLPPAGSVNGPHIAFAPDQTLLVTAPEMHKVQRLARDGRLLGEWGDPGAAPGQLRLPTGITVDGNNVWIADTGNNRIQLWAIQ
jgi:DNA-binding beta-propeller fold protein YncE